MIDCPIDECVVKTNVPACLLALDPFVTENFVSDSAKCIVKPRFHQALWRSLRITRLHEGAFFVELGNFQAKVTQKLFTIPRVDVL